MRTLLLKHDYKEAVAELKGQHPAPAHADQTINEDTVVIAPDASIPAVLLKQKIDPVRYAPAYELWNTVDELPSNRDTAVGSPSLPRLKNDGTLSERRVVPEDGVRHGILGYLDATPDQPCHKTPLTIARPELLDRNEQLVKRVDELYAQFMPTCYAAQRAVVDRVPCWRLWDTAFTTVYIIKKLRHKHCLHTRGSAAVRSATITRQSSVRRRTALSDFLLRAPDCRMR